MADPLFCVGLISNHFHLLLSTGLAPISNVSHERKHTRQTCNCWDGIGVSKYTSVRFFTAFRPSLGYMEAYYPLLYQNIITRRLAAHPEHDLGLSRNAFDPIGPRRQGTGADRMLS